MNFKEIQDLIKLINKTNLSEFKLKDGEFEMTIGDEVRTIKGGDSYYIPPHVMHGCVCTKAGVLIDVFSPHREDFLAE